MQEICKYIDCISQICKKCAMKICRNMQFYMQHMQKSIYCIFCIYHDALPTLLMAFPKFSQINLPLYHIASLGQLIKWHHDGQWTSWTCSEKGTRPGRPLWLPVNPSPSRSLAGPDDPPFGAKVSIGKRWCCWDINRVVTHCLAMLTQTQVSPKKYADYASHRFCIIDLGWWLRLTASRYQYVRRSVWACSDTMVTFRLALGRGPWPRKWVEV